MDRDDFHARTWILESRTLARALATLRSSSRKALGRRGVPTSEPVCFKVRTGSIAGSVHLRLHLTI